MRPNQRFERTQKNAPLNRSPLGLLSSYQHGTRTVLSNHRKSFVDDRRLRVLLVDLSYRLSEDLEARSNRLEANRLCLMQSPERDRVIREVVDGQQRIAAVLDFMEGKYRLAKTLKGSWAGKAFGGLTTDEKDRVAAGEESWHTANLSAGR